MPQRKRGGPLGKPAEAKVPIGKPRGRNGGRKKADGRIASVKIAEEILKAERYVLQEGDPLPDTATPLDIMLCAMRTSYRKAGPEAATYYAEKAAPYLHAKIAQMTLRGDPIAPVKLVFAWAAEADTDGI